VPSLATFGFSRFGLIVHTERQTDIMTHTDAAKRLTQATVVGVSNKSKRYRE